jgi:hypothetical protein
LEGLDSSGLVPVVQSVASILHLALARLLAWERRHWGGKDGDMPVYGPQFKEKIVNF